MHKKLLGITGVFLVLFIIVSAVSAAPEEPFTFAHVTDTHILTQSSVDDYLSVLERLKAMDDKISFILNTGDLTSYGYPEEFVAYTSATKAVFPDKKIYAASGNHDTRWSNAGKQNFRNLIGPTNQRFDFNGVHFVILDSSMLLEQYGHFEEKDLRWLEEDLQQQPPGTPTILAFHHPPYLPSLFIDNEYELLKIIEQYNVPLILCGHTHTKTLYHINGMHFYIADSTLGRRGFSLIEIGQEGIDIYSGISTTDTLTHDAHILLEKPPSPQIDIEPINATTSYTMVVTAPGIEEVLYALDVKRSFIPLKEIRNGVFAEQVPYQDLPPGNHRIVFKLVSPTYGEWRKTATFSIPAPESRIVYSVPSLGAIQSSPIESGENIVYGSNDGNVYCVNKAEGKVRWTFKTGAEVVAVPAIVEETVYIGSLDGNFYAISLQEGNELWRYVVGSPVLASALVTRDKIFFGAGDYKMRCLERKTGTLTWEFPTGRLIKMRPASAEGKVFFGSWDGFFYCLDDEDGSLVWKKQISKTSLYAPATSNPVITSDKIIFVSHNYITHCLDTETGKELWNYPNTDTTRPSYSSPALYNDAVFLGSITGHLDSFAVEDGTLRFATLLQSLGSRDLIFDSSPAVFAGTAFVGSVGGNLYGVDCETGKMTWQFSLQDGAIFSSPTVHDGILYVGTNGGSLYAIDTGLSHEVKSAIRFTWNFYYK